MKLVPYLHFEGNCEEALNFYKDILNGKVEIVSRYDNPNMNAPADYKNKVLHGVFYFGDNTIMASDSFPGQKLKYGDSASLSISIDGEAEATRVFNALSAGGNILMPLEKQFWGDFFGHFVDRFGTRWMINGTA
jgi:PhnB protein